MATPEARPARSALFSSGFRPFFLLGAAYGPVALALGYLWPQPHWHPHEMLFGFAAALVCGVLLTALPSWAGAREVSGAPLAALAALWLAGRAAILGSPWLPPFLVALADCALVPVLGWIVARTVANARRELFYWTLLPLAALAIANIAFHVALARGAEMDARWALRLALHALMFLFTLYGGLFIPAFTRRWLHERGERAASILMPLEYATAFAMLGFASADLLGAPSGLMVVAALAAAAVHAWRFARWRGWKTGSEPLLWCIHLGYAWLIASLLLRAVAELMPSFPRDAWVHAFTLGAYGMLKIGLLTRVALRHTGRPLRASAPMRIAFLAVLAAALLRLAYSVHELGAWALTASALAWSAAFLAYLAVHGPMLLAPSLPRVTAR
jgi:uncharacterized protein involved in response to NO